MKKIISSVIVIFIISFFVYHYNANVYTNKYVKYDGNDLLISIDGVVSNRLPDSDNYYLTRYKCGSYSTKISWDRINRVLNVSNGSKNSGVACNLTFESKPKLSSMASGSYVSYVGNNGCSGSSCNGVNANYVDNNDMGYCFSADNKYVASGWRIFYSAEDTAYLVSAGSLECVKKSNNSTNSLLYINELNSRALLYCNKKYVYKGICNNYSVRSINEEDFNKYLEMKISDCLNNYSNRFCGYADDLIDNGGYYWYASISDSASNKIFSWNPINRIIDSNSYDNNYGLRVIVRMNSSVFVVSGNGTYNDPYVISSE